MATISLVGVGLGALFIAPLSDRLGRRKLMVACVLWFSIFTLAKDGADDGGTWRRRFPSG